MLNDLLAKNQSSDKLYVEDVFSTWLYTGTGASQTITNGIDLAGKGGLVWTKFRSGSFGTEQHALIDTARGANYYLSSDSTAAQVTSYSNVLTAFNSNGYTLGADTSSGKVNYSAQNYASWTFRKAPKFFDVVTYTGDGTTGRVINHNLGSSPGMIVFKNYSGISQWPTWHRSLSANNILFLNKTDASASSSGYVSAVSSTTFTINANVNTNGATFVAYLFAHDTTADGVIQCGSFTTDGSGNATVNLGWEPQFILWKNISTAGSSWQMADNMRGLSLTDTNRLLPNGTNAELSGSLIAPPNSSGFTITGTSASVNWIYLAIRRGPMRTPTDATKVFDPQKNQPTASGFQNTILTDVAFIKYTGGSQDWYIYDRLRGPYNLLSPSTAAEATSGPYLASFDRMTGFNVAAFGTGAYVSEAFRRAPGFFDVVCYTGTGSARTVNHNLGVAPELMIVKRRDTTGDWQVYAGAAGEYLVLNSTAAKVTSNTDRWNNTAPTSTVFSLGTNAAVNASGGTYVAYLFATCAGVSKIGSYTGTGTTKQIDCGFTNGARFVLIKRTDSTGDWYVYDSARGIVSGNDPYLLFNSTAAEVTNTDYIDPLSTGFELSSTAPAGLNANGGTYIYLAIA